jgi:hypothetical protein
VCECPRSGRRSSEPGRKLRPEDYLGRQALAIYRTSKSPGPGLAHKISNHGLTARTRQSAHTHGSNRAGSSTAEKERHGQRRVRWSVGGETLLKQQQQQQ